MSVTPQDIAALIQRALPGAKVRVGAAEDQMGHYAVHVEAPQFSGMDRIDQHRAVYRALEDLLNTEIFGLQVSTGASADPIVERIRDDLARHDVLLYMKGTPTFPQCGFSAALAQTLTDLGVSFFSIDVLADDTLRQAIKSFSNWPGTPQLYVRGKFIGGCDIVREMSANGELRVLFARHGLLP